MIIGIDIETTGFSNSAGIVEIGAVAIDPDKHVVGQFHARCKPGRDATWHPDAIAMHALRDITPTSLYGLPDAVEAVEALAGWRWCFTHADFETWAHNEPFERRFIQAIYPHYQDWGVRCTMAESKRSYDIGGLDKICEKLGILTDKPLHSALHDAHRCALLALELHR